MSFPAEFFSQAPISPIIEMGAYEYLWLQPKASFKTIAELFAKNPGAVPSDLVGYEDARATANEALSVINEAGGFTFGIRVHGASQYPKKIRDAAHPVELLYYRGNWIFAESKKAVAIVGSRKPSEEGIKTTQALAKQLVDHDYTIVSGLAAGIDTAATLPPSKLAVGRYQSLVHQSRITTQNRTNTTTNFIALSAVNQPVPTSNVDKSKYKSFLFPREKQNHVRANAGNHYC